MLKKVLFFNDPAWNVRDTSSTLLFWHSSPPLFVCCCFLSRATAGCSSRSRVSPPGRPHRFHKPSPAQAAHGKCMMSLGNLTKGASWEELIEACLRSFGKSSPTCSEFQQLWSVHDDILGFTACLLLPGSFLSRSRSVSRNTKVTRPNGGNELWHVVFVVSKKSLFLPALFLAFVNL